MGLNKQLLQGVIGRMDLKEFPTTTLLNISLAVTTSKKDSSGAWIASETEWHTCKVFKQKSSKYDNIAQIMERFGKGDNVTVEGKSRINSYTSKDGKKMTQNYINVENIHLNRKRQERGDMPTDLAAAAEKAFGEAPVDEVIF